MHTYRSIPAGTLLLSVGKYKSADVSPESLFSSEITVVVQSIATQRVLIQRTIRDQIGPTLIVGVPKNRWRSATTPVRVLTGEMKRIGLKTTSSRRAKSSLCSFNPTCAKDNARIVQMCKYLPPLLKHLLRGNLVPRLLEFFTQQLKRFASSI